MVVVKGSTVRHSDITMCDRFLGRDPPGYRISIECPDPQTPEVPPPTFWLSSPCVWPREDDYSSCYDLPLIIGSDRSWSLPSTSSSKFISTQPLSTPRRKSSPSQPLRTPWRNLRTRTTIPHSQLLADDGQAVSMNGYHEVACQDTKKTWFILLPQ